MLSVSVASGQVSTDQQPSPENNTMYLWGDASLASGSCFTDFSSDGATEVGFGEYDDTENIDFSCTLSEPLSQELFLDSEGSISLSLGFLIQSTENSGDDLVLSFSKDSELLAQEEFILPTFSDEQVNWNIPITDNMSYWEEGTSPVLHVQFNKPGPTTLECLDPNKFITGCDPKFRMYYSDNTDGLNVEGFFPILNSSDPGAINPNQPVGEDEPITLSVGEGAISVLLFSPWFIGIILFVGFITMRSDRFQLGVVLEEESEETETVEQLPEGKTLEDSYRARVLTLCALYVAQGIPWGFITVTFVTFLAGEGVGAGELALLLTLGTLPWSLKFLWGPVIDRFQYPKMGRRRPWVLVAQLGMIISLSAMLLIPDPTSDLTLIASMFLIYNIFTSLQDVSTDALAVDVLKPHELEKVNSYMFTAKAVGGIIGGAGLGTIIGFVGIKGAIFLQIPILVIIMLVPLFMTERPGEKRFPWSEDSDVQLLEEIEEKRDIKDIFSDVKTAFSLRSAQLGIGLSLVMSLSFFMIPVLPLLFVRELGWSEEQFNATKGGLILVVTMIGYMIGGQLGKRFGGKMIIIYSALGAAILNMIWGVSEPLWASELFMMSIWCLHTIAWAMVAINTYSLMMKVTWGKVGGTQFTGYMAMMNLSAIIGYQLTDPFATRFDYPTLFLLAGLLETFVILVAVMIDPDETNRLLPDNQLPQPQP
ncbi:MFS transporter [Candidatus Poseidoniales archaeon]|nr:MFS transporter [Candidatus Poseidoniales archaeon]